MISETITFNFDDEQQQKRFHARLAGETKLASMFTNLADGLRVTEAELEDAESSARSQAIDDCIKVAQAAASELGKFHGPSKPRSEIYRSEGAKIVASRLEALKDTKEKEAG